MIEIISKGASVGVFSIFHALNVSQCGQLILQRQYLNTLFPLKV